MYFSSLNTFERIATRLATWLFPPYYGCRSYGRILKNCSIEEIKNSIHKISSLSAKELKMMARKAWEFARANHTRKRFAQEYRKTIDKIIAVNNKESIRSL